MLRFENSEGIGPFRGGFPRNVLSEEVNNELNSFLHNHYDFPTPWMEELYMSESSTDIQWFCAYINEELLKRFCTLNQFKALIEAGYKLYKIEASQVQWGSYQNVFTKESLTNKTDITEEFLLNY